MSELLLELLSEEIPARMQARAAEDLRRLVCDGLKNAGLSFDRAEAYATPRRLALVVDGLPLIQPDRVEDSEERGKGISINASQQALEGFLGGTLGLNSGQRAKAIAILKGGDGAATYTARVEHAPGVVTEVLVRKATLKKGEMYVYRIKTLGRHAKELLPEILLSLVPSLTWPKSMRWESKQLSWVRPIQGVLAIFDGRLLQDGLFAMEYRNRTIGHRFLAPKLFSVKSFADYKAKLRKAKVILDPAERRAIVARDAEKLAKGHGLSLVEDDSLMNEVVGLVEWPVVLMGTIDDAYMDLPPEVLTTTMRHHQKYFSLRDKNGRLAPRFIVVAGTETKDKGKAVIAGNERVLRARLSDAKFFWDHDRKRTLESRVPALKDRVFHAKLGSDHDRVERLRKLAAEIATYVPGADSKLAERAALLCKADLTTGMVGEFPELQGVMGRYYALHDRENPAVADAIAAHYSPLGPNDACPTAPVSVAVALADKIDTLVGFFAIDEKPTGSKDPFALRRAALGVIRLIVENKLRLPLAAIFKGAEVQYAGLGVAISKSQVSELLSFFADRLKVALRDKGVRHDLIDAVFAVGGEDDLVRLLARVDALGKFLGTDDGANLLVAYRRAANILKIEEKRDGQSYAGPIDKSLLTEADEKRLHAALDEAGAAIRAALGGEDFAGAMAALAKLRAPVDAFFDRVTVNCDDRALRANRLRLLSHIRSALGGVADFSKIEGEPRK